MKQKAKQVNKLGPAKSKAIYYVEKTEGERAIVTK
jgi:hypothetical protein